MNYNNYPEKGIDKKIKDIQNTTFLEENQCLPRYSIEIHFSIDLSVKDKIESIERIEYGINQRNYKYNDY
jgi:hypothetical protein